MMRVPSIYPKLAVVLWSTLWASSAAAQPDIIFDQDETIFANLVRSDDPICPSGPDAYELTLEKDLTEIGRLGISQSFFSRLGNVIVTKGDSDTFWLGNEEYEQNSRFLRWDHIPKDSSLSVNLSLDVCAFGASLQIVSGTFTAQGVIEGYPVETSLDILTLDRSNLSFLSDTVMSENLNYQYEPINSRYIIRNPPFLGSGRITMNSGYGSLPGGVSKDGRWIGILLDIDLEFEIPKLPLP